MTNSVPHPLHWKWGKGKIVKKKKKKKLYYFIKFATKSFVTDEHSELQGQLSCS